MNFPDLPHLTQLQKDLWQWPKSRASVMVGAGFSLNAEPLAGVTTRFLTWQQLNRTTGDWHRGALADRSMVARPIAQSSRSCCAESDDSRYSSG